MTGFFHPLENYRLYRTQGLDVQISVKALAGCGPSEERKRTLPVMEFPARNVRMLHNKSRKSKGETVRISNIYMQETMQVGLQAADERKIRNPRSSALICGGFSSRLSFE